MRGEIVEREANILHVVSRELDIEVGGNDGLVALASGPALHLIDEKMPQFLLVQPGAEDGVWQSGHGAIDALLDGIK